MVVFVFLKHLHKLTAISRGFWSLSAPNGIVWAGYNFNWDPPLYESWGPEAPRLWCQVWHLVSRWWPAPGTSSLLSKGTVVAGPRDLFSAVYGGSTLCFEVHLLTPATHFVPFGIWVVLCPEGERAWSLLYSVKFISKILSIHRWVGCFRFCYSWTTGENS